MDKETVYNAYNAEALRETEYPMLQGETYLDHTGTTLYAQSALGSFVKEMSTSLLGNPHSDSRSSQLSTKKVDEVRKQTLEFFQADPEHFDLVFVLNATAAVKLVLEALQHVPVSQSPEKALRGPGLWIGYHLESHTSIVGMRELADAGQHCFVSDDEVESWIGPAPYQDRTDRCPGQTSVNLQVGLFAYPGQTNLTGRRLPLHWPGRLRKSKYTSHRRVFSLLDAAALASTASLDCFRDPDEAPDFTAVSFYKIFGFPDLGGLIVRKQSAYVLLQRPYFGGGTVEMVTCSHHPWHSRKFTRVHEALEDGTVPFHNIIALGCAITIHKKLYSSQEHVSRHTTRLTARLYELLSSLRHPNGLEVCKIYQDSSTRYGDSKTQGSIVAFNIRSADSRWLRLSHIEEAANEYRIHLRTGTVCNPGGSAKILDLEHWELFQNYTAGVRCGCRSVLVGYKASGIIRVSVGAMSTIGDVERFVQFVRHIVTADPFPSLIPAPASSPAQFRFHTLMVYPIKGCAAYTVPDNQAWHVNSAGLQWDRQWCLVNLHTGLVINKMEAPRLPLIKPQIDSENGVLRISVHRSLHNSDPNLRENIEVPLFDTGEHLYELSDTYEYSTTTIKKSIGPPQSDLTQHVQIYQSPDLSTFLTAALAVPCTLARFSNPQCLPERVSPRHSINPIHEVTLSYNRKLITERHLDLQTPDEEENTEMSLAVALTETLRANALISSYSDTANRQWYLMRIGRRDMNGKCKNHTIHYGRMKAVEVTAERQGPEIFEATSPVVRIVWKEDGVGDDAGMANPVDGMLPVHVGQIMNT